MKGQTKEVIGLEAAERLDVQRLDGLLRQTAGGDTEAFAALYAETKGAVFGFCLSLLRDRQEAEDATHDCFVRVFTAAGQYRRTQNPMAWILTVAKNLCLHRFRDRKRDDPASLWVPETDETLTVEDRMTLSGCMRALSEEERHIAVLHAVSGLKFREIAALLEMPLSTVLSKYNRGMKKLRELWQKGDAE